MRMFSLLAFCLCVGVCHASSKDKICPCKKDIVKAFKKNIFCKKSIGFAAIPAGSAPFCVQKDTVFNTLEAKKLINLAYADGEFGIQQDGSYFVRYFAKIRATNVSSTDFISLGVCVNGEVVQETKLFAVPDSSNPEYPFAFSAKQKMACVELKAGDKVSLKIVDMMLVDGAAACVVSAADERPPVAMMLMSKGKIGHCPMQKAKGS